MMLHPAFLPYAFAAVMVAISVYSAGRLAAAGWRRRAGHADVNIAHGSCPLILDT